MEETIIAIIETAPEIGIMLYVWTSERKLTNRLIDALLSILPSKNDVLVSDANVEIVNAENVRSS